jgi:hypothetical protein
MDEDPELSDLLLRAFLARRMFLRAGVSSVAGTANGPAILRPGIDQELPPGHPLEGLPVKPVVQPPSPLVQLRLLPAC